MSEKKFRAWDAIKKEMVYGVGISPSGNPIKEGCHWFHPESTSLSMDIMQYTGLKDKNGKEIYEGDIVDYRATRDHPINRITIRWDVNCFNIPRITWHSEIIGNIYENPELTGDKK